MIHSKLYKAVYSSAYVEVSYQIVAKNVEEALEICKCLEKSDDLKSLTYVGTVILEGTK